MSRFTVRFDDSLSETITERAKKRDINTAEYIRSLVELGMRIEDAQSSKEKDQDILSKIQALEIKNFSYLSEVLILVKNIFANSAKGTHDIDSILKDVREKAQIHAAEQLKQFSSNSEMI